MKPRSTGLDFPMTFKIISPMPDGMPIYPHPLYWDGINDCEFACDEVDGIGLNPELIPPSWDSSGLSRATAMGAGSNPNSGLVNDGEMPVDAWVIRENRMAIVPRDRNKVRAYGRRGSSVT